MKPVAKAALLDKHGMFAKREADLHHVNLEFDDGSTTTLTVDEWDRLTDDQQEEIRNAGALPQEREPSPSP